MGLMARDGDSLSLSLSLSQHGPCHPAPSDGVGVSGYSAPVPAAVAIAEAQIDAHRRRIREWLPRRLDAMADALQVAREALDGPDPEAALGYLAVLEAELAQALAEHR